MNEKQKPNIKRSLQYTHFFPKTFFTLNNWSIQQNASKCSLWVKKSKTCGLIVHVSWWWDIALFLTALWTKTMWEKIYVKLQEKTLGQYEEMENTLWTIISKVWWRSDSKKEWWMFKPIYKAGTENRTLCQAKRKATDSWQKITHGSRFEKSEAQVKAERQLETSDKNEKNKSTLMDNFRILLKEKHNERDRTRTQNLKK